MITRLQQRYLILAGLLTAIAGMVTLVSYSVPLYRLFCAVTGANGTTGRVAADTAPVSARRVTVLFNTDVAPGMDWRFQPVQPFVSVKLGQLASVYFSATNLTDHTMVGHAAFNVTPVKAAIYFKKVQCFCFTEESLGPHRSVQMPVQFFVDPRIADHEATADITTITLSYEFFISRHPTGAADLARFAAGPPDPARGATLFAANCAACHALDHAKVGPALAGVVGRVAGTQPGYPYSAGLQKSGIVWTPATLATWLANPQADVPGALMPMAVTNDADRRDIIAYLGAARPS